MSVESLIPHRAPMRWINALTDCTETTATATACFGATDFAVVDGKVLESALVECVAQTVAAAMGKRRQTSGDNGKAGAAGGGMLVAASNFEILHQPMAGQVLRIEIRETKRLGPMLMVAGTISCDGQMVAKGELSLYV